MNWKVFFATGCCIGYIPKASGTFGALLALIIYVAINYFFGNWGVYINAVFVAIILYPSIRLCTYAEKYFNEKDPQMVVLDEMVGLWVALAFHTFSFFSAVVGFFLFRLFDIVKPFPIQKLEHIRGGIGIIIDDIIAGVYANIALYIVRYLFGS